MKASYYIDSQATYSCSLYSLSYRAPYCPWFPIVKHRSLELDVQQRLARFPIQPWLPGRLVALLSAIKGYLLAPYILAVYSTFLASGVSGQNTGEVRQVLIRVGIKSL